MLVLKAIRNKNINFKQKMFFFPPGFYFLRHINTKRLQYLKHIRIPQVEMHFYHLIPFEKMYTRKFHTHLRDNRLQSIIKE